MKPENHCGLSCLLLLLPLSFTCFGRDTITSQKFIKDPATIISSNNSFQLGFFTPLNSTGRYVGIWYSQISLQTVVWVANNNKPLNDSSGIFTISKEGNLVVSDGNDTVLWSSNVTPPTANTSARLLDSGNLVLEDPASGKIIWESFKHPSDKFLSSMKFITDTRTKEKMELTSWNTPFDPSTGKFSLTVEVVNIVEGVIWNGRSPYWRTGPWNGQSFIGVPDMDPVFRTGLDLTIEDQTFIFSVPHNSSIQDFVYFQLTSEGNLEEVNWDVEKKNWNVFWSAIKTQCDYYGTCGTFGICNPKASPICSCLQGFKPKNENEWNR